MTSKRPASISDVSRASGVHRSTVWRVLTDPSAGARVGAEARDRVLMAARQLHYQLPARLKRRPQIGLLNGLNFWMEGTYQEVIPHLVLRLRDRNHDLVPIALSDAEEWDHEQREQQLSGLLVLQGAIPVVEAMRLRIPSVLINAPEVIQGFDLVQPDDRGGAEQVAKHLLALGHRRILYLAASPSTHRWSQQQRLDGVVDTCRAAGATVDVAELGNLTLASMVQHLSRPDRPTAVVSYSRAPRDLLLAVVKLGMRVPDQLSIALCDGIDTEHLFGLTCTGVHMPMTRLLDAALERLFERVAGTEALSPTCQIIAERLTVGESSAAPSS